MEEKGKKPVEPDQKVDTSAEVQGIPPEDSTDDSKKYSEKTQEELIAMLTESEKILQQKATREKELLDTVNVLQDVQKPKQQPREGPYGKELPVEPEIPKEDVSGLSDEDYLNAKQTRELFEKTLKTDRENQQKETLKKLGTAAGMAHEQGKQSMKNNPELFKGIENEVSDAIFSSFNPYVNQGYDVSTFVRDPGMWESVAKHIRLQREEYGYLKPSQKAGLSPVSSVPGQIPNPTKQVPLQAEPTIELDDKSRYLMSTLGLTEEEAKKGIVEGRRKARGED